MKCPQCGIDVPDSTRFCSQCGSPLLSGDARSMTETVKASYTQLLPGDKIAAKYTILEKLGEGGMGVVYKALDVRLQREVALKFLSPHLTRDSEARERFIHEARAASALDHSNICTIHEIDETDDGLMFIAMAHYQGETLRARIKRGPLIMENALDVARQIAEGLARAHGKGIIHRDIKSANVIINNEEVVKIVDFGLAKLMGMTQITKAGTTMGTVAYMSPEQARGDAADHRADIWALGVVLYEMVTGSLPFKGEREETIIYSILNEDPVPVSSLLPDIPVELEKIIARTLQKNPQSRYQHVREFLADLHGIYTVLDITPDWRISRGPWLRRRKWLVSPVFWVFAALIVCGLVAWLLFFPSGEIPFQERDWIVITDFDNQTGDDVFDKSLNTALRVNIQQSRYINVFPASRVKETLQRMGREEQGSLTEEVAGEVALREGLKAVLSCKIDQVGEVYNLTSSIIDPTTQVALRTEDAQALSKDRVLAALDDLAGQIRKDLGESLKDIQDQRVRLPEATTSSLEALKLYAEGVFARGQRHDDEAVALLNQALELDPEFAMANAQLGAIYYWGGHRVDGDKHFSKALELLDRLTERERLTIEAWIPAYRGNRDEATIKYKVYLRKYPDDTRAWHNLAHNYLMLHRFDEAIEAFNRHLELYPTSASAFINLATCYTATDRFELAIENYKKGFELNPQYLKVKNLNSEYGFTLVAMGDLEKAEEVFNLLLEGDESLQAGGHRHMALLNMYQGKFSRAEQQLNEAIRLNNTLGNTLSEYRDRIFLVTAHRNRGLKRKAVEELATALEIRKRSNIGPWWLQLAAKIYARMGMPAEAEALFEEVSSQVNEENRTDRATMNLLQGEIALARGKAAEAVEYMERAYLLREDIYVLESVAYAYAQMRDLDKAVEKYSGIIGNVDLGWESQDCWVQAHYQLGKIYTENEEPEKALRHLERFVELWKDGEPDLPALKDARIKIKALLTRLQGR